MSVARQRILTTHVGSLPRPRRLLDLYAGAGADESFDDTLRDSVAEVVSRQRAAGIDIVSDGEFGKPLTTTDTGYGHGTWLRYVHSRLSGCDLVQVPLQAARSRDQLRFAEFYGPASHGSAKTPAPEDPPQTLACTGPIRYVGHGAVQRDIANLLNALPDEERAHAFLPVASPASIALLIPNLYYDRQEEYILALGRAMQEEYKAIAKAGLLTQIDDPVVVGHWDTWDGDLAAYRRYVHEHVELLNEALAPIETGRLRYHICWGSWQGPHSTDLPLRDVVDIILRVQARGISIESGNPRHEHEWRVWEDTALPADKVLIAGVVSHKTMVLEHPELVSERLVRYARCVGVENVIASTDCGLGGRLTNDLAWAKLEALAEGARLATAAIQSV
jgi:5-methyltetrahydropteroyltriglutamate--homocysteine methyltransferase